MITIADKKTIAWMQGWTPPELRNAEIEEPTSSDIANLMFRLSSTEIKRYGSGKYGENFVRACNDALATEKHNKTKNLPPPNGRSASTGVMDNIQPHEVLPDLRPIDPQKK